MARTTVSASCAARYLRSTGCAEELRKKSTSALPLAGLQVAYHCRRRILPSCVSRPPVPIGVPPRARAYTSIMQAKTLLWSFPSTAS